MQGIRTADAQGLPCIYSRNAFAPKLTSVNTAVAHHKQTPEFHEEVHNYTWAAVFLAMYSSVYDVCVIETHTHALAYIYTHTHS